MMLSEVIKKSWAAKIVYEVNEKGCWICQHSLRGGHRRGEKYIGQYPSVSIGGRNKILHRLVYGALVGRITKKRVVRHACDETQCINPEHLLKGTYKDNSRDAVERGRHVCGERVPNSKLVEKQVIEIFIRVDVPYSQMAKEYGITKRNVLDIKNGSIWSNVTKGLVVGRREDDKILHATKWMERCPVTGRILRRKASV